MALGLTVCVGQCCGQTFDKFMILARAVVGSNATVNARSAVDDFGSAGKRIAGDCGAASQCADGAEGCAINADGGRLLENAVVRLGWRHPRMHGF